MKGSDDPGSMLKNGDRHRPAYQISEEIHVAPDPVPVPPQPAGHCGPGHWLLRAAGVASFFASGLAAFGFVRYIDRPPEIVLEPAVFDFGEIEHAQQLNAEFSVRNNGKRACTLSHFTPSCGCMTVSVRHGEHYEPIGDAYSVQPGEEVTIVTGMTGGTMQGEVVGSVQFQTSSPDFPALEFVMKARLFGRVHAIPGSLDLGRMPQGSRAVGHFILTDGGKKPPFVPGRITSTIPSAIVTSHEVDSRSAGIGGRPLREVFVELPGAIAETVRGEIQIFSADNDEVPALRVPFVSEVLPRWRASPPAVVFPRQGASDRGTIAVQFQDYAGRPASLVLCDDTIPQWLHVNRDPANDSSLRLTVEAQTIDSPVRTKLRLRPADSSLPEDVVELPIHCLPDRSAPASGAAHPPESQ